MPTAQVTIQYKNPPKEGKTNWSLKDSTGVYYSLSPELAAQVQQGEMVTLDFEAKSFNGRTLNMVKTLSHGGAQGPSAALPDVSPPGWGQAHTMPQHAPQRSSAPAPRNGNGHSTDKQIFVTGVVGRAMGSGKFETDDISALTSFACQAWEEFFRG